MVYHAFFVVVAFHRFRYLEVMVSFCSFHVQGLLPQLPEFVLTQYSLKIDGLLDCHCILPEHAVYQRIPLGDPGKTSLIHLVG